MSSHHRHSHSRADDEDAEAVIGHDEAEEEIEGDADMLMEYSSNEETDMYLQNDSVAHFDLHTDSIFCIAQHPLHHAIIATGGGDDLAYIWDSTPLPPPVLPHSYESNPRAHNGRGREGIPPIARLEAHTDSVNAIAFTLPNGHFICTGGLDGQLRVWRDVSRHRDAGKWEFLSAVQEVDEINWLAPCPAAEHSNVIAFGANDGSVWVYRIDAENYDSPLEIIGAYYLHTASCTAGAWTPDGKLLATVSEDSSLYVWDIWGDAAAAGLVLAPGAKYVVAVTGDDERFLVEGGLYSVAISLGGGLCAVGGADGMIRVVSLPRLPQHAAPPAQRRPSNSHHVHHSNKVHSASAGHGAGGGGQVVASLQAQEESIESLAFSDPPLTVLASGSVDGTIVLFDAAHNFAVRRKIEDAHDEEAVIKVEFVRAGQGGAEGWLLTSCGNDGVVRRWDCRGGTASTQGGKGLVREWRGHRGGGEGGGVLGFVQGSSGRRIVTAGDDGIALVFQP